MRGLSATVASGLTMFALGCAEDPSLRIEVVHDPIVASDITSTTLTVYASELFSCEKVEFGDLSDEQLTAGFVDEITIGAGDLEMSRTDPKVIVARGFDRDGTLFAAGCGEKALVRENDSMTIDTHRVASVSVNGIGLEDGDPFGLVVTLTDPRVDSLPDRSVSWRVHGAVDALPFTMTNIVPDTIDEWTPVTPPCSDENGVRRVHPTPPGMIGGFATDIRVSWSSDPQRRFTTFTPVNDAGRLIDFKPVANSLHWCTGRIDNDNHRMVCLEDVAGAPVAKDYEVTVANGGAQFTVVDSDDFAGITFLPQEVPLQVFSVKRGTLLDAYVLTTKGRVIGVFGPSVPGAGNAKLVGVERIIDAMVMQTCGASPATLLVHVLDPTPVSGFQELRTFAADGTGAVVNYLAPRAQMNEGLKINQTGCVAELRPNDSPILRQIGVVDSTGRDMGPRNATTAFFQCDTPSRVCEVRMAVPRAGVGFLAADDPTSDPNADPQKRPERMVGATFDASGTVLSVTVLQKDTAGVPRAVELERITSAAFPQHLVSGRFDGDGQADLFWDIGTLSTSSNFQLSYARPVGGERLSALSAAQDATIVIDTAVADVNDDGIEDLIIMSVDAVVATVREVRVIPAMAPIKNPGFLADPPCIPSGSP